MQIEKYLLTVLSNFTSKTNCSFRTNKNLKHHALLFTLILLIFSNQSEAATKADSTETIIVPVGGNSWVRNGSLEKITKNGLENWGDPNAVWETYIRFSKTGRIKLFLNAGIEGKSKIRITLLDNSKDFSLDKNDTQINVGEWDITRIGYVKISVQGLSKAGNTFAEPREWILEGSAIDSKTAYVKDNNDNYFYWGRRGPSVHLNYALPANEKIEWFYNEVTVPENQDVIGSYFMANGFGEGYFGMQVNSEKERRILFSVWSPFKTDDPKSIPSDKRIDMLSKGSGVYTGEFGNEGSGGQSYLKYNWKAGKTYKFLLHGKPSGDSTTTYTAYFFAPEENKWQLIASFKRPKTQTYLKRLHSFLENFIPETGDKERKVNFGNQWIRTTSGNWTELRKAKFTADATARKGYRLDYAGGKKGNKFFLQNCGFFSENTEINENFEREAMDKEPVLDLDSIAKLSVNASK